MIGEILGSIIGPMTEGMASAAQYQASKHERNVAWRRAQQWELIGPTLRMEGLKNAGLNPILAATGGFKTGDVPNVQTARPGQLPRFQYSPGAVVSAAKQGQVMDAAIREANAKATTAENEAKASEYAPSRAFHDVTNVGLRGAEIEETVRLMRVQQLLMGQQTSQAQALARKYGTENLLLESEVPAARALQELYEKYPELKQLGAGADVFQKLIPRVPLRLETGGKTINVPRRGR